MAKLSITITITKLDDEIKVQPWDWIRESQFQSWLSYRDFLTIGRLSETSNNDERSSIHNRLTHITNSIVKFRIAISPEIARPIKTHHRHPRHDTQLIDLDSPTSNCINRTINLSTETRNIKWLWINLDQDTASNNFRESKTRIYKLNVQEKITWDLESSIASRDMATSRETSILISQRLYRKLNTNMYQTELSAVNETKSWTRVIEIIWISNFNQDK